VSAQEVLGVEGEEEDDGGGDYGADGALECDGGGGDGGVLVTVAVAGDAEASALRRLSVAAVRLVGDVSQVVEDLLVGGDAGGEQRGLAVNGVKEGELCGLGGVPEMVERGGGVGRRGEEILSVGGELGGGGLGRRVRADGGGGGGYGVGGRGGQGRRTARDVGVGAGLVGGKETPVVADVHGPAVKGVDGAAEPPLAVVVESDGLVDFDERDGGDRVE